MTTACADRGSDLAVVYRGDVAGYRTLVQVRLDTGSRMRVVVPSFPSAAKPEQVATRGELPVAIVVLTAAADTAVQYVIPALRLAPRTSYQLGIVIGRRPAQGGCNGAWAGTALTHPIIVADSTSTPDSLFVSATAAERGKEAPRCDE